MEELRGECFQALFDLEITADGGPSTNMCLYKVKDGCVTGVSWVRHGCVMGGSAPDGNALDHILIEYMLCLFRIP